MIAKSPSRCRRCAGVALASIASGILLSLWPGCAGPGKVAAVDAETPLIRVLQSSGSPAEKDAACVQLKRIGTARCVPALAALLTDEQLSHSARLVLEPMTAPEAGRALIGALDQTSGLIKAGIIDSLRMRRETAAVPALAVALNDNGQAVAIAAAAALGDIGNGPALDALQRATANQDESIRAAVIDAELRCGQRRLAAGARNAARRIFESLRAGSPSEAVRVAAFRGLLLSSGAAGVSLACDTIAGPAGAEQVAAFQIVHELNAPGATAAFAQLLPRLDPPRQIALIDGISQRGDPVALPAIVALADHADVDIRVSALTAIGELGDVSTVTLLANAAARSTGAEQTVAREALIRLRRGQPGEAMLAQLPGASPSVQTELARALAARRESNAVPKLQALARQGSESARKAATIALARLGETDSPALAALVQLVVEAKDDDTRTLASTALSSACQHIRYRGGRIETTPFVQGLNATPIEARLALLPICARISDEPVRISLRAATNDPNPRIADAAVAALCDTSDPELLPELMKLATSGTNAERRTSGTAACVRLAADQTLPFSDAQRRKVFQTILAAHPDAAQKRLVLGGLAALPDPQGLPLALPLLDDTAVRDDAGQCVIKLAPLVSDSAATEAALKKTAAVAADTSLRESAELALRQSRSGFGFITAWELSGPYRQEGRDYADLFDFAFNPEVGEKRGVTWKRLPAAKGPRRTWLVDLREPIGRDECVAYARTWLHCDAAEPVQCQVGSEGGMKIWVNQKLIHTNGAAGPLAPAAEKISTTLKPGWNSLLVKITQRKDGAAFCLQLLKPDGSPVDGLRVDPVGGGKN